MDSRSEELCCSVCRDVFREPLVLSCSHSFCRGCLKSWWREKPTQECPMCKRRSSRAEPPVNLVLKNLCESVLESGDQRASDGLCSLHCEKLRLFCLDHQQPACLVCRDSEKHTNHTFRPISEAVQPHRKELQETLEPLKDTLKLLGEVQVEFDLTAQHIKAQARDTEQQILEQFKKLHRFLEEEEEARMAALREEEEQKSQMMKEMMEALSRDAEALSDTVRLAEEQLRADDVSFLHGYKAAVERAQRRPLLEDPQLPSGALIDQAKHLGNLTFNIWNKMKNMVSYSPVVLDPNTAHPQLTLSEDLISVRQADPRQLPANPERFDDCSFAVLGSEGFASGTHSWDVFVGSSSFWELGVAAESVRRRSRADCTSWGIWFCEDAGASLSPVFRVYGQLQRVRVTLDFSEGTLSFSDPYTKRHVHAFRHCFTERMFPYFDNVGDAPMKVLPMKVCVKVKPSC